MSQKATFKSEVVFIDDGSTDSTLQVIKECARKYSFVKYAVHPRNRGLTDALHTGFEKASGDIFVFYPADLQYVPADIPSLVQPIIDGSDMCTGWKQGKYNKRFVSSVYNWISRKIFNLQVHDLNAVKAFRKEVVEQIFMREDWHRYLVVLAADLGYKIDEVKIPLYERHSGESKFSIWRIPIGVLDMVAVKFQISFLKKPLLFFGLIGSICFFIGFLIGLWAIYLKYWLNETQLPLLYLVILLTGLGFGLFLMGFMAEGQTAIKEELTDLRRKMLKQAKKK